MVAFGTKLIVTLKTLPTLVVDVKLPASLVTVTLVPLFNVTVIICVVAEVGDVTDPTIKRSGVAVTQLGVRVRVSVIVGVIVRLGVQVGAWVGMGRFENKLLLLSLLSATRLVESAMAVMLDIAGTTSVSD